MQTPQGVDATHGGELLPVNEISSESKVHQRNLGKLQGGQDAGTKLSGAAAG